MPESGYDISVEELPYVSRPSESHRSSPRPADLDINSRINEQEEALMAVNEQLEIPNLGIQSQEIPLNSNSMRGIEQAQKSFSERQ